MKINFAITSIYADNRRIKNDGLIPLKLRVNFKGERKYYATGFSVTLEDWKNIKESNSRGELKKISNKLNEIQLNAQKCCDSIGEFSFQKFENAFFPKETDTPIINLKTAYQAYIKILKEHNQIGTASSYNCSCVSLHKFKPNIKLEDISSDFLRAYENWFLGQGRSITSVGFYLRPLRALLNFLIENGQYDKSNYPFGKRKYIIPTGKNVKKALSLSEIAKIYNYKPENGSISEMCRDYWIFIYLCNGLNVKDFCHLKYKNIENNFIVFHRAKTINTRRANPEAIRVAIKEDAKNIIAKWGQLKVNSDTYIFPHLKPFMSHIEQFETVKLLIDLINTHMKKIAIEVGIEKPVTTYYARHSFATILKNSGVSTEFISEALGHTSLSTTKNYLAGFEHEALEQTTNILISFKNPKI